MIFSILRWLLEWNDISPTAAPFYSARVKSRGGGGGREREYRTKKEGKGNECVFVGVLCWVGLCTASRFPKRGGGGSGRESLLKEVEEIVRSPTYKELSDDNAVI